MWNVWVVHITCIAHIDAIWRKRNDHQDEISTKHLLPPLWHRVQQGKYQYVLEQQRGHDWSEVISGHITVISEASKPAITQKQTNNT